MQESLQESISGIIQIVLEVHPDKNPDPRATDAFKKVGFCLTQLSAAYTCLSDPDKKRRYDATGGDPSNMYSSNPQQATRGGFGGGGAQ